MPLQDPELEALTREARVVVFRSGLTDVSRVERMLRASGTVYRLQSMPMGDQAMRERFRRLKEETGWPTLPIIFVDGELIGGENELLEHPLLRPAGGNGGESAPARWLGFAGLIPFFLPVAGIAFGANDEWFLGWLTAYAAVILAFVGALQWGLALDERRTRRVERFVVSIVPALLAWLALFLPERVSLLALAAGFLGIHAYERATLWPDGYPPWFRRLRTLLTAGAILALLIGFVLAQATA